MIESREFDLEWEGRRCVVDQLGAKPARQVARRLLNLLGSALTELGASGADANMDVTALGALLQRLSDQDTEWLTDTFSRVTRIEREPGSEDWIPPSQVPDLVFGGGAGLKRWFRWLVFCVEMSCGDFFAGALAEAAERQARMAAKSSLSPTTSPSRTSSTASPFRANTPIV
jgi:hypothetical protein